MAKGCGRLKQDPSHAMLGLHSWVVFKRGSFVSSVRRIPMKKICINVMEKEYLKKRERKGFVFVHRDNEMVRILYF